MKVYVIKYTLIIITARLNEKHDERIETYVSRTEFMERVTYLNNNAHCLNIKVYSGMTNELNIETVLNPF